MGHTGHMGQLASDQAESPLRRARMASELLIGSAQQGGHDDLGNKPGRIPPDIRF